MREGEQVVENQKTRKPAVCFIKKDFAEGGTIIEHVFWYGYYCFLVKQTDGKRNLLKDLAEPTKGLAAALNQGEDSVIKDPSFTFLVLRLIVK